MYWFKPVKSFYSSVSENLASLESLADDTDESMDKKDREKINKLYRKLAEMFNE
jgi:hypothetical protein